MGILGVATLTSLHKNSSDRVLGALPSLDRAMRNTIQHRPSIAFYTFTVFLQTSRFARHREPFRHRK